MKKLLISASLALGIASLSAPATARNYDCSKAGNANKAACKSPAATSVASHKMTTVTTKATARNYDCTKAGNKNKAACKTVAGPVAPVRTAGKAATTQTSTSASYDCTKFYNKMRVACRTQGAGTKTSPSTVAHAPTPMTKSAVRQTKTTATHSVNTDSTGATAQCKDGSFSHSKQHSGSCSRHGGVAKFMS